MRTKYFNDGVIGNNKIKASLTKQGELIRLFYGNADYKQFLDYYYCGVKINESNIIYLHSDINNTYSQDYVENTNILQTTVTNSYFNLKIVEKDFVPISENVLVRNFVFKNENSIDLNVSFLIQSKILTNLNNDTCGYVKDNTLIQYNHDFAVSTFSNQDLFSYQINDVQNSILTGKIHGKDYIGMSPESAISYDIGIMHPGEEKELAIYVLINKNRNINVLNELDKEINRIKTLDEKVLEKETIKYWREYIKEHDINNINESNISTKVKKIYNRSILLFPLLLNEKTGGISAGIEVDEDKTKCGRYSYCWPRDAVFITSAFDIVGMNKETEKFYSNFCQMTQNAKGNWEQRFYTDGRLAPSWGYQVDETASVIFGVWNHYEVSHDISFLYENYNMCKNAERFLHEYIDDILDNKFEMHLSYDLWEEFEGYSLYSISSIYGALVSMKNIYLEIEKALNDEQKANDNISEKINIIESKIAKIKDYALITFYDINKNSFVRNTVDRRIDISLLGSTVPFNLFSVDNSYIRNTIERINMTLRTYTGGYIRYEDDNYMGGYNPWPIATLWMAWYYLEAGEFDKALECFGFVTNSASSKGLLGEQVNNDAMKPSWVIGLTWSHAMYLIIFNKLIEKGLI